LGTILELLGGDGPIGSGHTGYEIGKRNRIWTVMYKVSSLATEKQTDLSSGVNDDVIVTEEK